LHKAVASHSSGRAIATTPVMAIGRAVAKWLRRIGRVGGALTPHLDPAPEKIVAARLKSF